MTDPKRFHVSLEYSSVSTDSSSEKRDRLMNGGDKLTSLLKQQGVSFGIRFVSDLYVGEPLLRKVVQEGKNRKVYTLYEEFSYSLHGSINGLRVIDYLIALGVIQEK